MRNLKKSVKRRKPRQKRSNALLKDMVQGGFQVLEKYGLKKFSTNKLAAVTGVSIGSVYQYFENKDQILQLMVNHTAEEILHLATAQMNALDEPDISLFIEKFIDSVFNIFSRSKNVSSLLFVLNADQEGMRSIMTNRKDFYLRLKDYIDLKYPLKDTEKRTLRGDQLLVLIHSFMGLIQAIFYENMSPKESQKLIRSFSTLAGVMIKQRQGS